MAGRVLGGELPPHPAVPGRGVGEAVGLAVVTAEMGLAKLLGTDAFSTVGLWPTASPPC